MGPLGEVLYGTLLWRIIRHIDYASFVHYQYLFRVYYQQLSPILCGLVVAILSCRAAASFALLVLLRF